MDEPITLFGRTPQKWRKLVGYVPRVPRKWSYPADIDTQSNVPPVVKWRKAVLGPDGPPSDTTRLVLLVMSHHMNTEGGSCYPSIKLLALECGLSERAVKDHVRAACAEFWIDRLLGRGYQKGWKRAEYQATIPIFSDDAKVPRTKHDLSRYRSKGHGGHCDELSW